MKLFAWIVSWFKRLFGKKTDAGKFTTAAPGLKPEDVERERIRIAYAQYCKAMRKRGMTPQGFGVWVNGGRRKRTNPTGGMDSGIWIHAKHNGTFSPVKPIKGRTDLSLGGDVHRARTAGRIQTRAAKRKVT